MKLAPVDSVFHALSKKYLLISVLRERYTPQCTWIFCMNVLEDHMFQSHIAQGIGHTQLKQVTTANFKDFHTDKDVILSIQKKNPENLPVKIM